jgi:hypothetical protein
MTDITPNQADALAKFLLTVRPDWNLRYTTDAIAKMRLIDADLERITRVAIRGALTAKIIKPDVLAMHGEHWKARSDLEPPPATGTNRCRCGDWHTTGSPCRTAPPSADPGAHVRNIRGLIQKTTRYDGAHANPHADHHAEISG